MKISKPFIGIFFSFIGLIPTSLSAQIKSAETEFSVDNGVVMSERGIPRPPRWFADSRLVFAFEETGITQVNFYNPLPYTGSSTVFIRNLWDGFRYYLVRDDLIFRPEYTNNRIWPFGAESEWNLDNFKFIHKVMAIDQSIIIQLITPDNLPSGYRYKFDFNSAFALSYGDAMDFRYPTTPGREWKPWNFIKTENLLVGGYTDSKFTKTNTPEDYTFCCAVGANFPIAYNFSLKNDVHNLYSPVLQPGKTYCFIITFGNSKLTAAEKNSELSREFEQKIKSQFGRYEKIRNSMPVLISPNHDLNNYFSLLPMYHEALKITDHPGAIRAKTPDYWIWGWDGMTSNSSPAYWGDISHIKNMLKFYKETADPERGIAHQYSFDMITGDVAPIPAQCMYITLLQLYFDQTNDLAELKDKYPFARKLFYNAIATEVKSSGFSKGLSLFPDFRELIGETGNDISLFSNSVYYCSVRSLNRLSAIMGDKETLNMTREIIQKMENNFLPYFYNKEKKFLVSSVDATSLVQRNVYLGSSLRWENAYYKDLVDPVLRDCLDFYATHLVCKPGIRPVPLWCTAYNADANQLHSWWPVTDESFIRMVNEFDRTDLMDQWTGYLTYWYKTISCPEGISCLLETDEPEPDRWTSLIGSWNAYSCREWYQAIVHGFLGVDADAGGITFYPYSGDEVKLMGMHYLGKTFDIEMNGSGPYIEYIEVKGKKIQGTNKLPVEYYQNDQHINIIVKRTTVNPYPVIIKYGAGIILKDYNYNKGVIKTGLTGAGEVRLNLLSWKKPVVKAGGKQIKVVYNEQTGTGYFTLTLDPKKELAVTIMN